MNSFDGIPPELIELRERISKLEAQCNRKVTHREKYLNRICGIKRLVKSAGAVPFVEIEREFQLSQSGLTHCLKDILKDSNFKVIRNPKDKRGKLLATSEFLA